MTHKLKPRTLQIYDFTWKVLQKPLYPPFAHNRNKCLKNTPKIDQKSLKYHSGNGTKKKDNPKLFFWISHRKWLKTGPERRGEKVKFSSFFSLGGHLGPQGLPMELPGDSEEQFFKILTRFGQSFWQFFWCFRSDLLAWFSWIASKKCFLLSVRSHQN